MSNLYIPESEENEISNVVEIETLDRVIYVVRPSQIKLLFKGLVSDSHYFELYDKTSDDCGDEDLKEISEETYNKLKKVM